MVSADALLLLRWNANLTRDADGAPLIPPLFVAEQGPAIQIADIRPRDEATGVLGYVPGSVFPGPDALGTLADAAADCPLVIVGATGASAALAARELEVSGLKHVAAMAGGLGAWRGLGLATSRDPAGIRDTLPHAPTRVAMSETLTLEQVREHVGDPQSVRWIKLSSMVAHGHRSCIDGRDDRAVVGSPGGDGGEFLLSLAAIERATGRQLDEATIENGLLAHIDTFGQFYMHTDAHAFDALTAALRSDGRIESAVSGFANVEQWVEFFRHPAPEFQETLLEHLVNPDHIGCGHIRLMLERSDEYGTRAELVRHFLRAFHRLWWKGAPELELTLLPGDHGEGAVVNVRLEDGIWGLSRVPLISPCCGGLQMFVNHPDVASFLRETTVRSLVRGLLPFGVDPEQEGALQIAVDEIAAQQLGATIGALAKGLPIYDVVFATDGSFDVRR
ncbi:MAG: hypothetical protein V3T86_16805 [Planctomycetota bacterium]